MAGTCKWRGQRCAWWWLSPGAEGLCVPGAELDDPMVWERGMASSPCRNLWHCCTSQSTAPWGFSAPLQDGGRVAKGKGCCPLWKRLGWVTLEVHWAHRPVSAGGSCPGKLSRTGQACRDAMPKHMAMLQLILQQDEVLLGSCSFMCFRKSKLVPSRLCSAEHPLRHWKTAPPRRWTHWWTCSGSAFPLSLLCWPGLPCTVKLPETLLCSKTLWIKPAYSSSPLTPNLPPPRVPPNSPTPNCLALDPLQGPIYLLSLLLVWSFRHPKH